MELYGQSFTDDLERDMVYFEKLQEFILKQPIIVSLALLLTFTMKLHIILDAYHKLRSSLASTSLSAGQLCALTRFENYKYAR